MKLFVKNFESYQIIDDKESDNLSDMIVTFNFSKVVFNRGQEVANIRGFASVLGLASLVRRNFKDFFPKCNDIIDVEI